MKFKISYPDKKSEWSKKFGLNAYYAGKHWAVRKKDADYWHLLVVSELQKQGIERKLFSSPVEVIFYHNMGLDIDNFAVIEKFIIDSLKGYLLVDDNRKYYIEKTSKYHKEDYILIEIKEVK